MIYHKGATQIDQCAHRLMEYQISPDWHGSTIVGDYIAFYHEEKLFTVRHLKKGVSCLVYAHSPYDAIEKVRIMGEPRWIPVTERLPEKTGKYLVCGQWRGEPAETWVCELMSFGKIKGWANEARNPAVTHWMPLPEPPKEDE